MIYKLKRFFNNLWDYRGFLWYNNWYDDHYIFYIIREKLKIDVKYYKKFGIHVYVQKDINKMDFCIKVLNRIIKDEYLTRALLLYEKKYPNWGDNIFKTFKSGKRIIDHKWFGRCSNNADMQKQQDIDYLFKYMGKHIQNWWD